jgi:thiol:disulfide interchange protein
MIDAQTLELSYRIADGYYMYRDRFHFSAEGATLGEPGFRPGNANMTITSRRKWKPTTSR